MMNEKEKMLLGIEKRNSWLRFIVALLASVSFLGLVIYIITSGRFTDEVGWAAWTAFLIVTEFIILQWLFKRDKEKEKFDGGE